MPSSYQHRKAISSTFLTALSLILLLLLGHTTAFYFPHNGTATITHYSVAGSGGLACDCKSTITKYPIAAVNQNAFGANTKTGAGPACGECYRLTLWGSVQGSYNITPGKTSFPEIIVKVADQCPNRSPNLEWCSQTDTTPNKHGAFVHFDLSEKGLPAKFFPQPLGYDFGTWWANYTAVSCKLWDGYGDANNVQADSVGCCPLDPLVSGNYCKFASGRKYDGSESVPEEQISGDASRVATGMAGLVAIVVAVFMWVD